MSQQINLFNPIFLKQKKYFSAVAMAQALGLVLVGALLVAAYANYRVSNLKMQAANSSAQLAASQAQLIKFNAEFGLRQKSKTLESQISAAESEILALQQVFDILKKGDFGNTQGYSEYLKAFSRQTLGGLWLTGFNILGAGNEIGLQGRALQPELVPAYISRLRHEPIMRGKSFSSLEMNVPQIELANKDPAAPKQMGPAPYIEFNLMSSGIASTQPATAAPTTSEANRYSAVATPSGEVAAARPTGMAVGQALGIGIPALQAAAAESDALGVKGK